MKSPETWAEWVVDVIESDRATATGWVYFIQEGKSGPIKVGYTKHFDIAKRLSVLQTGNPRKLRVAAVVRASRQTEQTLHNVFGIGRMCGEWFKATTTGLEELIKEINKTPQQSVLSI